MDEKDIQENLEIMRNTVPFLSFKEKVEIVFLIQKSVPNWNQAVIDHYVAMTKEE